MLLLGIASDHDTAFALHVQQANLEALTQSSDLHQMATDRKVTQEVPGSPPSVNLAALMSKVLHKFKTSKDPTIVISQQETSKETPVKTDKKVPATQIAQKSFNQTSNSTVKDISQTDQAKLKATNATIDPGPPPNLTNQDKKKKNEAVQVKATKDTAAVKSVDQIVDIQKLIKAAKKSNQDEAASIS